MWGSFHLGVGSGRLMKSNFNLASLVAIVAVCGLVSLAFSSEPEGEAKAKSGGTTSERTKSGGTTSRSAKRRDPYYLDMLLGEPPSAANTSKTGSDDAEEEKADQVKQVSYDEVSKRLARHHGGADLDACFDSSECCDECGSCDCTCVPLWEHRSGAFADFLYLRPGNIDYIYAVEQTGTLPTDSPTGPVGRLAFEFEPGYRVGFSHALTCTSSLQASYTSFQNEVTSTVNATPGTVLIFQPGVPSIPNVGASSVQASATHDIEFQLVDVNYRGLLFGSCDGAVNYFGGVRYANLNQLFTAEEDVGAPIGITNVNTEIAFEGFGVGIGLDAMRRSCESGLLVYGRASANFLAGEMKADYLQTTQFGPISAVGNTLDDYRIVTILNTELGIGWQSCNGLVRVTAGYEFAGWFNSLTIASYIPGVQNRRFDDLYETLAFDGLVARVEVQF
jgi:hypothetical protein